MAVRGSPTGRRLSRVRTRGRSRRRIYRGEAHACRRWNFSLRRPWRWKNVDSGTRTWRTSCGRRNRRRSSTGGRSSREPCSRTLCERRGVDIAQPREDERPCLVNGKPQWTVGPKQLTEAGRCIIGHCRNGAATRRTHGGTAGACKKAGAWRKAAERTCTARGSRWCLGHDIHGRYERQDQEDYRNARPPGRHDKRI